MPGLRYWYPLSGNFYKTVEVACEVSENQSTIEITLRDCKYTESYE